MAEEKQTLFRITEEQRFRNVLHALDDLGCEYQFKFKGVKYAREIYDSLKTKYGI